MVIGVKKVFARGTSLSVNTQSACSISGNKYLSKKLFKQEGILVPKSWLVKNIYEARQLIIKQSIFPCVIKPMSGSHGDEIYANIENLAELDSILTEFQKSGHKDILIEEHIPGADHRVLVVGDKVAATLERVPAHVVGDGKSTIRELIKMFNQNPLVGIKYEKPMCKIHIDFELIRSLKKVNLKTTSVPQKDRIVTLKQTANISVGGISKDVTETVSESTKSMAIKAARAVGMEFCGVDIIYNPATNESYVLEVNDSPGIDVHHYPVIGKSQNVAKDIVDYIILRESENVEYSELAFTNLRR